MLPIKHKTSLALSISQSSSHFDAVFWLESYSGFDECILLGSCRNVEPYGALLKAETSSGLVAMFEKKKSNTVSISTRDLEGIL